ncbi:MAG: alpha/beta hydrolase [Deltaproteobacteria bacterium]|nr:alpha/beta hydrolase [Deltaproteobacteria bacterium]
MSLFVRLQRLVKSAVPDLRMDIMHTIAHRALIARGAEAWTSRLAGHVVQRYAMPGTGSGPPVLLLHGLNASVGTMAPLVPFLARVSKRVAVFDLPAHGRSQAPDGPPLSLIEYGEIAREAAEELAHETGDQIVLVGNSLGGALALYVAQKIPERIAGLVGLNPAGAPATEPAVAKLPKEFASEAEGADKMARLLFNKAPLAYWLIGRDVARGWSTPPVQKLLDDARAGTLAAQVSPMLAGVKARTLILWGAEDSMLPYASADEFRRLIANVQVEIVPDAGHVLQLELPLWTGKRVARFVREL